MREKSEKRFKGKKFKHDFKSVKMSYPKKVFSKPGGVNVDTNKALKISDLATGMRSINIKAKVVEVSEPREVFSRRSGRLSKVATAVVADESGKINLSLWNEQIGKVKVNDTIQITNGYVTEFRGVKHLNIGRFGDLTVLKEQE
ncbi:MAG: OB-fold nucleic acid binding domain-containing protein [Candidatus Bathyarchaeota archaeon]